VAGTRLNFGNESVSVRSCRRRRCRPPRPARSGTQPRSRGNYSRRCSRLRRGFRKRRPRRPDRSRLRSRPDMSHRSPGCLTGLTWWQKRPHKGRSNSCCRRLFA